MWVYGDPTRTLAPRAALHALGDTLAQLPPGADRPGALADAFVDASALVQVLADREFARRGEVDARSPAQDTALAALTDLARALLGEVAPDPQTWRALARGASETPVQARLAEGFAFYALHPLAHARAARQAGLGPDDRVVGVRSIGAGLAAMVAAAAGAPPPVTVRPVGPPFTRTLRLAPELLAELAAAPGRVAICDEGPGLSGSSFLAVADALAGVGVGRERLVLLPSHPHGPGSEASPAARALWREAPVHVVEPDWGAELPPRVADLTGALLAAPEDLSGGAWRAAVFGADPACWPAAHTVSERRKFRLHAARGTFLLKWAGLGVDAHDKLDRARVLADAGLIAPVLAVRDGWLVQSWVEGRPLGSGDPAPLRELAAGLALRSRAPPAPADAGASPETLAEMARVNTAEALGDAAGRRAQARVAEGLAGRAPPRVWTDGRLHGPEWLACADGRVLKTDALDHARAHDLIGAQEIGWDVVGAAVEWELSDGDVDALAGVAGAPRARLPALRIAYLAFQLGLWTLAHDAHAHAPDEQHRIAELCDRYARALVAATA